MLQVGEHAHRGRLANLGIGGLLASTTVTVPERLLSRAVEIEIRLDTRVSEWLQMRGRILRIELACVAIAFDQVPANVVRMIDEMSTASHASRRVVSVVLVDATASRRDPIAEAFRAVGCTVLEVTTPLEAIVTLGEARFEPDLIAIADSLPTGTSTELREFVEREHPRTKLVTIGDTLIEPEGIANWLSSADPGSDLAARVRQLLGRRAPIVAK
jgi:hypothetical protein